MWAREPGRIAVLIAQVRIVELLNNRQDIGGWNTLLEHRDGMSNEGTFVNSHRCSQSCHDEGLIVWRNAKVGYGGWQLVFERRAKEKEEGYGDMQEI